ncbi:hypothetical protein Tco_1155167 [Tanacetum coccineum]
MSQINRFSQHHVYSTTKILSMVSVKVVKRLWYGYLEEIMNKLFNLDGDDIVDLAVLFPKELYTTSYDPKGVVYPDSKEHKSLMRANKLYKFSDGTLKSVHETLHYRLLNFKLGYNKDMPRRKWTNKDQNRTNIMVQLIDKQMLERRIMRSLEVLVGGRKV